MAHGPLPAVGKVSHRGGGVVEAAGQGAARAVAWRSACNHWPLAAALPGSPRPPSTHPPPCPPQVLRRALHVHPAAHGASQPAHQVGVGWPRALGAPVQPPTPTSRSRAPSAWHGRAAFAHSHPHPSAPCPPLCPLPLTPPIPRSLTMVWTAPLNPMRESMDTLCAAWPEDGHGTVRAFFTNLCECVGGGCGEGCAERVAQRGQGGQRAGARRRRHCAGCRALLPLRACAAAQVDEGGRP